MIYLILDSSEKCRPMLVQCDGRINLTRYIKLSDTQEIISQFTDEAVDCLNVAAFVMVSGEALREV